jgi:DNA topoisomerase I
MKAPIDKTWWRRRGSAKDGFHFVDAADQPITSDTALERIRALVIPPAWQDVHIAADSDCKVQAWGRDVAGRKQYIYNQEFVALRERRKWRRVLRYARALPRLREATNDHLRRPGLDREKVLATVVRLMSRAFFRVGSERYAVRNRTFGICTLEKGHLELQRNTLIFRYKGKRHQDQRRVVADTPLVEVVESLLELPGRRLFQYRDGDGRIRSLSAQVVNQYIQEILGERYTSKDLRTFGGSLRAATVLAEIGPPASRTEARRNLAICCRLVAIDLGNTPAICRSAYIHPAVLSEYEEAGRTIGPLMREQPRPVSTGEAVPYYPEEAALLRFLERHA